MTERRGIVCAGNWIVDLVHHIETWPREHELTRIGSQDMGIGGGAANVASALARFDTGLPIWPMGAIGDDDYGRFVQSELAGLGLPHDFLKVRAGTATAHTHVMSVTGRSRTFFYQGGANDALQPDDLARLPEADALPKMFYLGYLMLLEALDRLQEDGSTGAAAVLERAQRNGLTTCVDLVSTDRADFAESVGCALPYIDYLILNEIEAARACGETAHPSDDVPTDKALADLGQRLIDKGVRNAVVIHCPQKAVWTATGGRREWAYTNPASETEMVSPLGAGDAFCAGIVYGLHEGWTAARCLRLANAAARASLSGATATGAIPTLAELQR